MKCKYCYEGEKEKVTITEEIIERFLDFLQIHMKKIGEEKVDIITHGGEPL